MTVHAALAIKLPEMAMEHAEAMAMAEAMLRVEAHYNIAPSPKTQAIIGLLGTGATIYGPKFAAVGARANAARRRAEQAGRGLHQFRPAGPDHGQAPSGPQPAPNVAPFTPRPGRNPPASNGSEVILPLGVPDGGKINFGE